MDDGEHDLTERAIRCPLCKEHFVAYIDGVQNVFVRVKAAWKTRSYPGTKRGTLSAYKKQGAALLRDPKQNDIPRHPGQRGAVCGDVSEDDGRTSEGADSGARSECPESGVEDV